MRRIYKKKRKFSPAFLALCIAVSLSLVGGLSYFIIRSQAAVDSSNAKTVYDADIDVQTELIGTHLINIQYMFTPLYEIALKSANDSAQNSVYYKSELTGGTWYEITSGNNIGDISTGGVPVSKDVIEQILLQYHTRTDGLTYDLMTGQVVCIFDIYDPYDLSKIPELISLQSNYENLKGKPTKTETDTRDLQLLKEFFEVEPKTDETDDIDKKIAGLQNLYKQMCASKEEYTILAKLVDVMDSVDAGRRYLAYEQIEDLYLANLQSAINKDEKYSEGEISTGINEGALKYADEKEALQKAQDEVDRLSAIENPTQAQREQLDAAQETLAAAQEAYNKASAKNRIDQFILNTDLLAACNDAVSGLGTSATTLQGKIIVEGSTIQSQYRYQLVQDLVGYAETENLAAAKETLYKLVYLDDISDGRNIYTNEELALLEENLLPLIEDAYDAAAGEGTCEEYNRLPGTATEAARKAVLDSQKTALECVRSELQFLYQAKLDRISKQDGVDFMKDRIDDCHFYYEVIHKDPFESYAKESVDAYKLWLTQKLSELENDLGGEADDLEAKKDELEEEYKEALDAGDLDAAARAEAELDAAQKNIDAYNQKLADIINSDTASDAEKADAAARMTDGSTGAAIEDNKNQAISDIQDGSGDINAALDALAALAAQAPAQAANALSDISDALSTAALQNPGDAAKYAAMEDALNTAMSTALSYAGADFSNSDLAFMMDSFLASLGDLSGDELDRAIASLIAGFGLYVDATGAKNVEDYMNSLAATHYQQDNPYIYLKYKADKSVIYLNLKSLARVISYRYVFGNPPVSVDLVKGGSLYQFNAFSQEVIRGDGKREKMDMPAGFQSVVYVSEYYTYSQFGYMGLYLRGDDYAVMLDDEMNATASDFFDYLMDMKNQKAANGL